MFVPTSLPVGGVLGGSLSVYAAHFPTFTGFSLAVFSPLIVWLFVLLSKISSPAELVDSADQLQYFTWALTGATFLLQPLATGAIIYGVFRHKKRQPVSLGKCLAVGFSRFPWLLAITILIVLAVVAVTVPLLFVVGFLAAGLGPILGLPMILAAFIPAAMIICSTYVAPAATVVEKTGVIASLKRSARLTGGNRGRIFTIVLVFGIFEKVLDWVLKKTLIEGSVFDIEALLSGLKIYLVVLMSVAVLLAAVTSTASALTYFHLRTSAEGADQDQLASVFD
jgi:hypothetical protein